MKVLQLVKTSDGTIWAFRQMRELVKMGVEVHVAIPIDGSLIPRYQEAGIKIHEINYSLKNYISTSNQLNRIINEVQPDIIHSHFVLTTLIMRLALRRVDIPRIFQVPGPLHLENWFFRNLDLALAQKKTDFWVGSCKWTKEKYFQSGIDKSRVFLSYYGTDLEFIKMQTGVLKQTLGLQSTDIVVGMVAYMYPPKYYLGQNRGLKGHEDFIDALSLLQKKYPNLYGVCIGGAWNNAKRYEDKIITYGKKKCGNRLIFMGTRNDVPALYGDMDIVVHPSHSENLGGAGESLLLEVATIASNIGGFPDIVINEKTGLLVPIKNPKKLAEAIDKIIKKDCDVDIFKKSGRNLCEELLDVKKTAKSIADIYFNIKEQNEIK